MQRHDERPLKNCQFGSKIRIKKKKTCEKRFYNLIRVDLCKKPLKKPQIFDKREDFKNRPLCKRYSLFKMVSLGQKLKFKKTCEKCIYNLIIVVLWKKPLGKTPNIREMRRF